MQLTIADHLLTHVLNNKTHPKPLKVNLFVHCCDAEEDSRCGKCYRSLERWLLGKDQSLWSFSCWVFMTLMFHWGYGGYIFCWRHDAECMVVYNWHVLAILLTLDKDYFRGKGQGVLAFWSDPIFWKWSIRSSYCANAWDSKLYDGIPYGFFVYVNHTWLSNAC